MGTGRDGHGGDGNPTDGEKVAATDEVIDMGSST